MVVQEILEVWDSLPRGASSIRQVNTTNQYLLESTIRLEEGESSFNSFSSMSVPSVTSFQLLRKHSYLRLIKGPGVFS